jgi:hypothetical protein
MDADAVMPVKSSAPVDATTMNKEKIQAELDQMESEACRPCLFTGVLTCFGLATYLCYLAFEEELNPRMQAAKSIDNLVDSTRMINTVKSSPPWPVQPLKPSWSSSLLTFKRHQPVPTAANTVMRQSLHPLPPPIVSTAAKNRPFLLVMAAGWVGAGLYRWHLG